MSSKTCRECNILLDKTNCTPSFLKRGFRSCRKCVEIDRKERNINNRKTAIKNLGGKCNCCGIDNYDLLSIDHINGGGQKDRNSFGSWGKYLRHLANLPIQELKQKYQTLCYNCNYCKGFFGKCSHDFNKITDQKLIDALKSLPVPDKGVSNTHLSAEVRKLREKYMKKIQRTKHKLEMIAGYGGECTFCKEKDPLMLVLDHINNNGYLEKVNNGSEFFQYMRSLGYPGKGTQLQLLCHNCNAKKEYIDNRINKSQNINKTPEVYIKQEYSITEEQDAELWRKSRELVAKIIIANNHCLAGINEKNASELD
jgi:hypothetical protein